VTPSDSCLDFIECKGLISFVFIGENSRLRDLVEHFYNDLLLEWESVLHRIVDELIERNSIVEILVASPKEGFDDVAGDLKRSIPLIKVLLGSIKASRFDLLHSRYIERLLGLKSCLLDC